MEEYNIKNFILKLLFCLLLFSTILYLFFRINIELDNETLPSLSSSIATNEIFFNDLKMNSNIGWFNLKDYSLDYEKSSDWVFICFQNMIAPTTLENFAYNNKIICYYTSPIQLSTFCKKNKKYKLIRKDILTNFALFEKIKK